MIRDLQIQNIVLIDRLDIAFNAGLSVLTGETGAGKSILLDALGLLRGDRAEASLVRAGMAQAQVRASVEVPPAHPIWGELDEQGIAREDMVVLRRVVSADGKSRAFINDQAVSVALLRRVGSALIDLHGQFDTSELLDPAVHRVMLDRFGGLTDRVAQVARHYADWRAAQARFQAAQDESARAARDEDDLRSDISELEKLAPQPGEEGELVARKQMLSARAQLVDGLTQALMAFEGEAGAEMNVASGARVLDRLRPKLDTKIDSWMGQIDVALVSLREVSAQMNRMLLDLNEGDMNAEAIEDRLYDLRGAARRHQCSVDELPIILSTLSARLDMITGGAGHLTQLQEQVARAERAYQDAARDVSAARKAAAQKLDHAMAGELAPLKLDRAIFKTECAGQPGDATGIDAVRFLVATNPGSAPAPLDKIASGGEISRLMLALKAVMAAGAHDYVTMIFDEVDSGLGGAVADAMALRLKKLSEHAQVLVVTHAPQVAARADHHFVVSKKVAGGTTKTSLQELSAPDRREEIARMLSGAKITDEARAAAQKLLELDAA